MKKSNAFAKQIQDFLLTFVRCGILGWCMEILFTSVQSFRRREKKGMGNTSVFMFPIYGLAVFLKPICHLAKGLHVVLRGIIYTACIFTAEYGTGRFLQKRDMCPWDYSSSPWNVRSIIRLDYAPVWFFTGLIFERFLRAGVSGK